MRSKLLIALPATLGLAAPAHAGRLDPVDASGLDSVYEPRRVAVLVGVDSYDDPALTGLRFAAKDASDLGRVLEDPALGDFDRVLVVTGKQATTAEGIRKAINLATSDLQRDDTFLLYLSGHGTLTIDPVDGTRLWFLPSDATLGEAAGTGLSIAWLEERVAGVEARRRVLVMDTCHNGRDKSSLSPTTRSALESMRGEPPTPRGLREVSESEARLFAAQYYQPAMEDGELGNGVYTHFLIQALSEGADQADLDGDGLVSVTEAHDWARDRTITYTSGMQVPRAEYRIVGREQVYLAGNASTRSTAERALLTATDALLASARVLVDGQPRGVLPEVVVLEPGAHRVQVQDAQGRTLVDRNVRLRAGETVMVEDLLPDARPTWTVMAGAGLRHGMSQPVLHDAVGELEVGARAPAAGPRWLEPGAHVRATWGRGPLELTGQGVPVPQSAGEVALGLDAELPLGALPLTLGPSIEGVLIWRDVRDVYGDPVQRQAGLAVAPGARAVLRVPVGDRRFALRYDARVVPFRYAGEPEVVFHHGLALGLDQPR